MKTLSTKNQNLLGRVSVLALLFMAIFLAISPGRTHAQFATSEVPLSPLTKASAAAAINTGATAAATGVNTKKEIIGDPLAFAVKRVVIHSITKSTVNWINSGFNGSPAFVQDLQSEFLRIGDTVATSYIDEFLQNDSIQNNPFRDEIGQAVLSGYFSATGRDGFYIQNPFTLDKVSSDPRAFINGDYKKGGLNAWRELVFNPGNNPLLLRDAVSDALHNKIGSAVDNRKSELVSGNGYNSFRGKCAKRTSNYSKDASSSNVLSVSKGGVDSSIGKAGTSAFGGGGAKDFSKSSSPSTSLSLTNTDNCLGFPILTPGALISHSANKFLADNGLDQLIAADEVSEVVNALAAQLINQVLGSGGLSGTSAPRAGGGRSYADRLGDPKELTKDSSSLNMSTAFLTTISNQSDQLAEYRSNWQTIADEAAQAKKAFPNTVCSLQPNSILAQAGTEISNATSIISSIQKIQSDLAAAVSTDPTTQTELVAAATEAYQKIQSTADMPSIRDITYAKEESTDRQANTDTGTPASLYTQMLQLKTTGTCSP